ncbi:hypothetical protein HYX03_00940 [Candidatus Woesearchaeota archaeon]|nr:hypothetical protein [Candidatus Woesearchaeota archaeon]
MDSKKIVTKLPDDIFSEIQSKLKKIEEKRKSKIIFSIGGYSVSMMMSLHFHRIIRKIGETEVLELVLDSGGGQIDSASKIVNIFREYCKTFNVIVPFFAKSAATYIAVSADNLILCKAGELGPVDPQVKHPALDTFFPASSIKDALEFIESTKDPYIKLTMADKLDPFLIGAYRSAMRESRQYLEEIPHIKKADNMREIVFALTDKYIDHGYPINKPICKELKLKNYSEEGLDKDTENKIYDIHDMLINEIRENNYDLILISSQDKVIIGGPKKVIDIPKDLQTTFPK